MKSAKNSGVFTNGHDPRRGNGPQPGAPNAGRPPSDVRALCRELIDRHQLLERLAQMAAGMPDVEARDQIAAAKLLLSYGIGAPTQVVEHTGKDGGPIEFLQHAKTEFQGRMDRITARLGAAAMPEGTE